MIFYIIIAISLVFSGVSEGIMDHLQFHYNGSNKFLNPKYSWENKWKSSYENGLKKIHVGENKFFLSSSLLVFLTDGWHLAKWLRNRTLDIAIIFTLISLGVFWLKALIAVIIFRILYGIGFYIGYK